MMPVSSAGAVLDLERSRQELSATMRQLRENLTPKHLFQEYVGTVDGERALALTSRAVSFMRRRPLPTLLVGGGGALSGLFFLRRDPRRPPATETSAKKNETAAVPSTKVAAASPSPPRFQFGARTVLLLALAAAAAGLTIGSKSLSPAADRA